MPLQRAPQGEQNGANFSFVALSIEELQARKEISSKRRPWVWARNGNLKFRQNMMSTEMASQGEHFNVNFIL